jgi:hypothetical protein
MTLNTAQNVQRDHATNVALLTAPNVAFTIGIEAADVIEVLLQLQDGDGDAIAEFARLRVWLTDLAPADSALASAAPSGGIAVSGSGEGVIIEEPVANQILECVTDANGQLELAITEVGADTWYMQVALPGGGVVSSAAITFA